jgi:hypothetical protein
MYEIKEMAQAQARGKFRLLREKFVENFLKK